MRKVEKEEIVILVHCIVKLLNYLTSVTMTTGSYPLLYDPVTTDLEVSGDLRVCVTQP